MPSNNGGTQKMTELIINGTRYRISTSFYAEYYQRGVWRVSASISNDRLKQLIKDEKLTPHS